jgi:hypothetical protein
LPVEQKHTIFIAFFCTCNEQDVLCFLCSNALLVPCMSLGPLINLFKLLAVTAEWMNWYILLV